MCGIRMFANSQRSRSVRPSVRTTETIHLVLHGATACVHDEIRTRQVNAVCYNRWYISYHWTSNCQDPLYCFPLTCARVPCLVYSIQVFDFIAEVLIRSQACPCGQSGTVAGFSQYFSFPLSVSFHQCSILIHSSTTDSV
jgi:hypothetical protein